MTGQLVIEPPLQFTDEPFYDMCLRNRDLRFERTVEGEIIVRPPTGGETGNRNLEIGRQIGNWTKADQRGSAFDSSTDFKLPNGADRSPDAAWIERKRLLTLTKEQKKKFLPRLLNFLNYGV